MSYRGYRGRISFANGTIEVMTRINVTQKSFLGLGHAGELYVLSSRSINMLSVDIRRCT